MDARHRLGVNVARLRKAAHMTQEGLAARANLHPTYISGIEGGHRNPSVDVLERISVALDVTIGDLFL